MNWPRSNLNKEIFNGLKEDGTLEKNILYTIDLISALK